MGIISKKAREAGAVKRRANMALRAKLAKQFGGSIGDYFPMKIEATIEERKVPRNRVPRELLPGSKSAKPESFPLDHPIFAVPAKQAPAPKPTYSRETAVIYALLDLIRRLV